MGICNHPFDDWKARALADAPLGAAELARLAADVAEARGVAARALFAAARDVRVKRLGRSVSLCAIVNAKSGRCSENCAFCAQSAHFDTGAPEHPFLDLEEIGRAARAMREAGARRFGIVTSGLTPSGGDFELLRQAVSLVDSLGMQADASCGVLTADQLGELKRAGLKAYHHNMETARSFFPQICTTHDYEDDVAAVRDAVALGLHVCSGGIFGLGESWEQRAELGATLRELGAHSIPVNFLHPIPGTPMGSRIPLEPEEALKVVAMLRFIAPGAHIRICGGRQTVFGQERGLEPLEAGASGIMIGDYLTTRGLDAARDRQGILDAGWDISDD